MLFFFLLVLITTAYDSDKVKKLSFEDTLSYLDKLVQSDTKEVDTQFDIHSVEERSKFKDDLLHLLQDHQYQRSWFAHFAGLVTFKNILLSLTVLIGIVFVVSLCKDILIVLGRVFGDMIWYLLTSKYIMYTLGYSLSGICFFKPDLITQFPYLDFFEQFYPLFGLLLFSVTFFFTLIQTSDGKGDKEKFLRDYYQFINILWILASLYTQISFMGTLTIILTFGNAGFIIGSYYGHGVQSGFKEKENLHNCLFLSILLNGIIIYTKFAQSPLHAFGVFETGIEFWGTFVGSIAGLIVSTDFYMKSRYREFRGKEPQNLFARFWASKFLFTLYCLFLMYTGTVFNVNSYTNLGGTFMAFCAIDIEYYVLRDFKSQSLTGICFIALVNLYLLKQAITYYPQYFLFMS